MGLKFHQGCDENGNVINPEFFTEGMADLGGEFNSRLDRDNFAKADIVDDDLDGGVPSVFLFLSSEKSDTSFSPDMTLTDWQGGDGDDANGIADITWTAPQDAHYDVHVSIGWTWNGSWSWTTSGTRPDRTDIYDTIMVRINIDGNTLAIAGPFEDGNIQWATYLCGSIQLPQGYHELKIECQVVRRIAQNGQEDGPCTNDVTINSRAVVVMGRFR
jgi:hypothetical protein